MRICTPTCNAVRINVKRLYVCVYSINVTHLYALSHTYTRTCTHTVTHIDAFAQHIHVYNRRAIPLLVSLTVSLPRSPSPLTPLSSPSRSGRKNEHLFLTNVNTVDLEYLASLVDAPAATGATVKAVIFRELPFSAAGVDEGFQLLKSRRAVGKIVFDIAASKAAPPPPASTA